MASNRIGKETIETEHGKSDITFYGNSFIAGMRSFLKASSTFSIIFFIINLIFH